MGCLLAGSSFIPTITGEAWKVIADENAFTFCG